MMNRKKLVAIIICVMMISMLTACSVENIDSEKSAEPAVSTVPAEETTAPSAVVTFAPTEKPKLDTVPWGNDDYTKLLPECTLGAVTQITPGDGLCLVLVEQVEESDAVSYMDELSKTGFLCADINADLYTAGRLYSKSGISVSVVYSSGMMTLMIQK